MVRGTIEKKKLAVTIMFIEAPQFLFQCSYILAPGHRQWLEAPSKKKLAVTILFIETIQFLCRCSYVLVPGHTQCLEAPPFFGGWSSFLKRDNTILLSMLIHLGAWTHTIVIGPGRAQKKPHGPCMFPARAQSTPNLCTINVQLTLQKTTVLAHLLTINVQLTYS